MTNNSTVFYKKFILSSKIFLYDLLKFNVFRGRVWALHIGDGSAHLTFQHFDRRKHRLQAERNARHTINFTHYGRGYIERKLAPCSDAAHSQTSARRVICARTHKTHTFVESEGLSGRADGWTVEVERKRVFQLRARMHLLAVMSACILTAPVLKEEPEVWYLSQVL